MSTASRARLDLGAVAESAPSRAADPPAARRQQIRIATIDWMRGLVMLLMVIDHASMAFDAGHLSEDSAMYPDAATMALPAAEFFTRWITHLCAPTFLFLAGTALALSTERRVAKGANAWAIDKTILTRGLVIALLDPTIVSLGSGRWTFQVLLAIGLSMMCMAPLRRLPSWALLGLGFGWFAFGELVTGWVWHPPGPSSIPAALTVATYGSSTMVIKYPLFPWLAMMIVGWVFGRHLIHFGLGKTRRAPAAVLAVAGATSLVVFAIVRYVAGYGDMFLHRADNSWQQWLHVSKYPPSLTYATLELGLLCIILSALIAFERRIGFRPNGILLVFGQTAMFFYIVHRLAFEVPATYFGLRGAGDLSTTYAVAIVAIVALYPACLWYRRVKAAHPDSFLKYI
jgi:uncharacterized membrane protein